MKPGNPSMEAMREQRAFRIEAIEGQLGIVRAKLDTLFKDKGGYDINSEGLILQKESEVVFEGDETEVLRESQEQLFSLYRELNILKSQEQK
ncbi:hypothetical protein C0581_05190 [Candidatus Parcubacteria bacterium]|nr:MAG: hypothetical protein C0581_05190 [Candidatus Parcubacteria bacterium]